MTEIKQSTADAAEISARRRAWQAKVAAMEAEAEAKRIPKEPNENKPVTHKDLNRLLDALRAHGIDL